MNEKQQVFNSLQNYYAISRLGYKELINPNNKTEEKTKELFLLMQNILVILFNNIISIYLYKLALRSYYLMVELGEKAVMEIESKLKDAITPLDATNLNPNDPMEEVMKVVVMFAKRYSSYALKEKTELVNNRYDTIYNELTKDDSFANIWMKINIKEANEFSKAIKEFSRKYKYNPLINVLIQAKNLIFNLAIALLFKLDINALIETYNELVLPIRLLLLKNSDCKEVVHKISVFADINYSKKHQMETSKYFNEDVLNYAYNNPLYIDFFAQDNGFLLDEKGHIPSLMELKELISKDSDILYLDSFLLDIIKRLAVFNDGITNVKDLIVDKGIILNELKKEGK